MERSLTFKGGVHPLPNLRHGKMQTEHCPIEVMEPPAILSLPCSQHVGAPAKPIVAVGDQVKKGQMIAEAAGFMSVPVHASVSGKVTAIVEKPGPAGRKIANIVIENDFQETLDEGIVPKGGFEDLSPEEIKKIIWDAGIVGLGGAGFPTHVKLSPPPEKPISTVIVNGAECEPFLTADHRIMLEHPECIIYGLKAVMKCLGVGIAYIAVEDNKQDAIDVLNQALDTNTIRIKKLQTKYPQGSEKQLIDSILGRQVPSGGLPMDAGVVVINASSAKAIADAIRKGMPIIDRVVTVTGHVRDPKNLLVRLGTPIADVVDAAGGFLSDVKRFISGGPMMGLALDSVDGPVVKTTSGLLALGDDHIQNLIKYPCIHCGRCASVCPIGLRPMYISLAAERYEWEKAEKYRAMDCISCGSCSYICPANRSIVQAIHIAKDAIAANRRKEK